MAARCYIDDVQCTAGQTDPEARHVSLSQGGMATMEAYRMLHRRGWTALIGCAALVLPMGLTASGMASAGGPATRSPAPAVDADYLYRQLYTMAKGFSYRISGADGDPRNAA